MKKLDRRAAARLVFDYALVVLGSLLVAVAAAAFLIPNRVVAGGVVGIATIMYYTLGTPVGMTTLVINVPLFLAGLKWAGGIRFAIRTALAVVVMSVAIDLLPPYLPEITSDPLLYTLYGGLLDGIGMGLVFRAGGTTGGTDVLARLLQRATGVGVGTILLATNAAILGTAAIVFGIEPALYAMIVAFVSGRVIDVVIQGYNTARSALIITSSPDEVRSRIVAELGRGLTILEGYGGFSNTRRQVIYCVVARSEVAHLKRLVYDLDPKAFVVISRAQEVLGEGFATDER
jgi:uncharacterized membrane-anchored protein YitT (DUF2179 family)